MNVFKKIYCRAYQGIYRFAMKFIKIPMPTVIEGENSSIKVGDILFTHEKHKVLVVTDNTIYESGLIDKMLFSIENKTNIEYVCFHEVTPNPDIELIEKAVKIYKDNFCDSIVAIGGGSSMDAAKGVGMRIARPHKSIPKLKGNLKVKKNIPLLIAIPTTAGTGSEATLASVVSNHKTKEKYAINDPVLVPKYAILDEVMIKNLPSKILASTGMDALTHAVEAYIGQSNTALTKEYALKATELIFANLLNAYEHPEDLEARKNMLKASYDAGVAFTRAYVGYVHAIAHTFGGFYNYPHGEANAIILPYVLEKYGKSAEKKLAELADATKISSENDTPEEKAAKFIARIKEMNRKMNIPEKMNCKVDKNDIPLMVKRASQEGNPLYPVPKLFSKKDFEEIYHLVTE